MLCCNGRYAGLKSLLLLFAAGGLMGWFHAPYDFWWLSFLVFPLLGLGVATATSTRQAFVRGWCFAFGYFIFGLYWIAHALFVDIAQFWWALPLAVAALPMALAIFWAVAAAVTHKWGGRGLPQILCLAAILGLMELLRGYIFTGFPWLLLGYVWVEVAPVRALAASVGTYGLTIWALLLALLPAVLFTQFARRDRVPAAFIAVLLLLAPALVPPAPVLEDRGSLSLRLVQPNIAQALKLDATSRYMNFMRLLELTKSPGSPKLVVWPETAVGFRLSEEPEVRSRIAAALPPGSMLFTGSVRFDERGFHNSVEALDGAGQILGFYDKSHLVPFGEYIPYRDYLPFDPVAGGVDFTPGNGVETLQVADIPPAGPLICYEVIFPGKVVNRRNPPVWLLNVTNDGWYGFTHGPYQHFAISRMRAVEEGLPLVRVANTGISGVIDANGNILSHIPLGAEAYQDIEIGLVTRQTLYRKLGNSSVLMLSFSIFLICFLLRLRKDVAS